eukprot:TRINITY_DN27463_c0_g1_i2.p1 TRINITY_DN27463_c0_g1~~TRINITY_DN27463_c0_g1_i2.p1  ORF type:complete len:631 (-),score=62.41 TRINITY_DN27463_c0_g1_i2:202-2016(-)
MVKPFSVATFLVVAPIYTFYNSLAAERRDSANFRAEAFVRPSLPQLVVFDLFLLALFLSACKLAMLLLCRARFSRGTSQAPIQPASNRDDEDTITFNTELVATRCADVEVVAICDHCVSRGSSDVLAEFDVGMQTECSVQSDTAMLHALAICNLQGDTENRVFVGDELQKREEDTETAKLLLGQTASVLTFLHELLHKQRDYFARIILKSCRETREALSGKEDAEAEVKHLQIELSTLRADLHAHQAELGKELIHSAHLRTALRVAQVRLIAAGQNEVRLHGPRDSNSSSVDARSATFINSSSSTCSEHFAERRVRSGVHHFEKGCMITLDRRLGRMREPRASVLRSLQRGEWSRSYPTSRSSDAHGEIEWTSRSFPSNHGTQCSSDGARTRPTDDSRESWYFGRSPTDVSTRAASPEPGDRFSRSADNVAHRQVFASLALGTSGVRPEGAVDGRQQTAVSIGGPAQVLQETRIMWPCENVALKIKQYERNANCGRGSLVGEQAELMTAQRVVVQTASRRKGSRGLLCRGLFVAEYPHRFPSISQHASQEQCLNAMRKDTCSLSVVSSRCKDGVPRGGAWSDKSRTSPLVRRSCHTGVKAVFFA